MYQREVTPNDRPCSLAPDVRALDPLHIRLCSLAKKDKGLVTGGHMTRKADRAEFLATISPRHRGEDG